MKILYMTAEDMNKTGGGKTHFIEIAQNLVKLGHELRVVLPGYKPVEPCKYGLDIHHVPTFKKNTLSYLLYEILNFIYLPYHILTFKPDAMYSRSVLFDIAAPVMARVFSVPYVIEKNGIMEDEFRSRRKSELVISLLKFAEKINLKLSNAIVCVTKGIKEVFINRFNVPENKLYVVPNGCNPDVFYPLDRIACKKELGLIQSHFYVGFVGSFAPWQGLDTLVEAMRLVRDKGYADINCLIVGDGEIAESIKVAVARYELENNIVFTGIVPYLKVPTYINAASVLVSVQPESVRNKVIGLSPLKLFEYLACGRAVIATRITGITEIIEEGRCGYLCEPGNPVSLAEIIISVYRDSVGLNEKGLRGRRLIEEKYNWMASARLVSDVIRSVIKKR